MALHLIKLCVGCESIDDLREWVTERSLIAIAAGQEPHSSHVTRMVPKRGRDLLDGEEDEGFFARFNLNSLMRGAAKDRAEFYAKALGAGGSPAYMTQDEVRALEDLNPMGGEADKLPKPTKVGTQPGSAAGGGGAANDNDGLDAGKDQNNGKS